MIAEAIPFEIHVSVAEFEPGRREAFKEICTQHAAKPLFIELSRGQFKNQPMFSKVIWAKSMDEAIRVAEEFGLLFGASGFLPNRLKIEVPLEHAQQFHANGFDTPDRYYEWHGKVVYERVEALLELCDRHRVHLSVNALKNEPHLRFITLREAGTEGLFQGRVERLTAELQEEGRVVSKQHFEYCIFDTNTQLDSGWLSDNIHHSVL